jgi:hypothetical protein
MQKVSIDPGLNPYAEGVREATLDNLATMAYDPGQSAELGLDRGLIPAQP